MKYVWLDHANNLQTFATGVMQPPLDVRFLPLANAPWPDGTMVTLRPSSLLGAPNDPDGSAVINVLCTCEHPSNRGHASAPAPAPGQHERSAAVPVPPPQRPPQQQQSGQPALEQPNASAAASRGPVGGMATDSDIPSGGNAVAAMKEGVAVKDEGRRGGGGGGGRGRGRVLPGLGRRFCGLLSSRYQQQQS